MFEVTTIHIHGRTVEVTPCSKKHKEHVDDGYLVLSCRKCTFHRVPEEQQKEPS